MNRDEMIKKLHEHNGEWDVIIVGGGATGLGAAVDSATRGFKTLLIEQADFAKATSSRSTKLIHGGLRYLQQGNVSLVIEALKERGLLCHNAPHLVHHLPFLVPNYKWWEGPFYGIGLKVYDILAGKLGIESSEHLNRRQTLKAIPSLESKDLKGGVIYYDGQFDDSRLAITLARTCVSHGGVCVNYMKAIKLIKKKGHCIGIIAKDLESNKQYTLHAKVVINATGIFTDKLRKMDDKKAKDIICPSQGIHLVLPKKFQSSETAILVPHTEDGRVIFIIPWHNRVIVGTTDTAIKKIELEPKPLKEEVDFLLKYAGRYLKKAPQKKDVLSVFAGIRPLVKAGSSESTATIARDHSILISASGLITIAGGKWTTYRKMAEDVINKAIVVGSLPDRECITKNLKLHGSKEGLVPTEHWSPYGSNISMLRKLMREKQEFAKLLHPKLPYHVVEVIWAVRYEMARRVEDVLSRRTRALLLDAKACIETAPFVAHIMAKELGRDKKWEKHQVQEFSSMAKSYYLV